MDGDPKDGKASPSIHVLSDAPAEKVAVSLHLEPEVLRKFQQKGPGWKQEMNDVLRAAIIKRSS